MREKTQIDTDACEEQLLLLLFIKGESLGKRLERQVVEGKGEEMKA